MKPNILLIMADQLVPFLTGAYGHSVVKTPNLDRLVAEGVRFDAAYTPYPLCAPARAALMTGQHASRFGCFDNAALFPADQPTIAHYLTNASYDTLLSGKMHFIGPDQLHGFKHRMTTDVFPANIDWVPNPDKEELGGHAHNYVPPKVGVRNWNKFLTFDEETQYRAVEYLRERSWRQPDNPFFLLVSYHHPHDPFQVTPDLWELYEDAPIDIPTLPDNLAETYSALDCWLNSVHGVAEVDLQNPANLRLLRRAYYGLVSYIDAKVGELWRTLEQTGEIDNTLILFTSDHGDMLGERGMVQKRNFYEWSARVPLIVRFPDQQYAGMQIAQPVTLLDIAPTLCDVVGVDDFLPMEGDSLLPLLLGGEWVGDRPIFAEYHVEKVKAPSFMVRQGQFKYVLIYAHGEQLFDLSADPHEWQNLADHPKYQSVVAELRGLIFARFDPAQLAAAGRESVRRRLVIRDALKRNGTHWDYAPNIDATKQYVR